MIGRAVKADPRMAARLVEGASHLSVGELRDEIARARAAVSDMEARYEKFRRRRRLRAWTDPEGVWHLNAIGPPDAGAQIMAAIDARRNRQFRRCGAAGAREHPDLYAFDGLHELALHATSSPGWEESTPAHWAAGPGDDEPGRFSAGGDAADCADQLDHPSASTGAAELDLFGTASSIEMDESLSSDESGSDSHTRTVGAGTSPGCPSPAAKDKQVKIRGRSRKRSRLGPPVKLLIRVDYDTWLRGVVLEGETCELAGYGPIPVSVARQLVATGDAFVAAILTKGRSVVGVAHLGRAPNAYQRSALEWLYPTCAAAGCVTRVHLQADHRIDWVKTHHTVFDELDLLCSHHHRLKTRSNWALVAGQGKRAFVPPDDLRHPRHGHSHNQSTRSSQPRRQGPP